MTAARRVAVAPATAFAPHGWRSGVGATRGAVASRAVPRVLAVDPARPDPAAVAAAADALRAGLLVGLPTETVYGLAADALNARAAAAVFAAKGRPADNPLIVHVSGVEALHGIVAGVTPLAASLAARWWPGPLTMVLDAAAAVPPVTTGGLRTVAVRAPGHPVALAVLAASGLSLAAPSANSSGRPSPTRAEHVVADLGDAVAVVLDAGPCALGVESTVVDARGAVPVVLRAGAVTAEQLGLSPLPAALGGAPASPGTRYRHYAPSVPVVVAAPGSGPTEAAARAAGGLRVGLVAPGATSVEGVVAVAAPPDAAALARLLYAALREAEVLGLDVLVVEAVEERGIGVAVMDRLRRAAAG